MEMIKPPALALIKQKQKDFEQIMEFCRSPKTFLKHLDAAGVDRAVLINYIAPEVIGLTAGVNQFISDYVKENPQRLLSCGSLHPRHTSNVMADVEQLVRLGIRMIKYSPSAPALVPQRLFEWREGTGNHLPSSGGKRHSRNVSHRHINLSGSTKQVWRSHLRR